VAESNVRVANLRSQVMQQEGGWLRGKELGVCLQRGVVQCGAFVCRVCLPVQRASTLVLGRASAPPFPRLRAEEPAG